MVTHIHTNKTLILHALQKVFVKKSSFLVMFGVALLMFSVLILVPVGRLSLIAFYYQVVGLDVFSLINMVFFSLILGTLLAMNVYLVMKKMEGHKRIGSNFLSFIASFFAGIFGSSVCVACLTVFLGFLGLPTIAFLVTYRKQFFILTAAVALIQLYIISRAIMKYDTCNACKISIKKRAPGEN